MTKAFTVRLGPEDMARLDVLRGNGSREQWVRNMIMAHSKNRADLEALIIQSHREAARAAHDDGRHEEAAEYNRLIAEADANLTTLQRRGE